MVSTRSQSHLSESQRKDDGQGDVNSAEISSWVKRSSRSARGQQLDSLPAAAQLDAIEEEQAATTERGNCSNAGKEATLVERVADAMFAALESGRDADARSSGEGDDLPKDEEDADTLPKSDTVPRSLFWRPELQWPGVDTGSGRRRQGAGAGTSAAALVDGKPPELAKLLRVPLPDQRSLARAKRGAVPDTAGKAWFDLPATAITDEAKNDLRVLRLRGAFDPKTFYKKLDSTKFPKHFQFGTVVEGAADYFAGRLTRRERKRTLTEEVMGDPHLSHVRQKRYTKMQDEKAQSAGRGSRRRTDNPRLKKKPRKPKH